MSQRRISHNDRTARNQSALSGPGFDVNTMLTANFHKQVFPLCADPAGWVQAFNPAF